MTSVKWPMYARCMESRCVLCECLLVEPWHVIVVVRHHGMPVAALTVAVAARFTLNRLKAKSGTSSSSSHLPTTWKSSAACCMPTNTKLKNHAIDRCSYLKRRGFPIHLAMGPLAPSTTSSMDASGRHQRPHRWTHGGKGTYRAACTINDLVNGCKWAPSTTSSMDAQREGRQGTIRTGSHHRHAAPVPVPVLNEFPARHCTRRAVCRSLYTSTYKSCSFKWVAGPSSMQKAKSAAPLNAKCGKKRKQRKQRKSKGQLEKNRQKNRDRMSKFLQKKRWRAGFEGLARSTASSGTAWHYTGF